MDGSPHEAPRCAPPCRRGPGGRGDRRLRDVLVLRPGGARPSRRDEPRAPDRGAARRRRDPAGAPREARARPRDPRVRHARARPARQRQLPRLCRPRPALRRVERVRGAGVLGRAARELLPGRRLRQLPGLLRTGRRRRVRRRAARRGLRRVRLRRAGVLDARLVRRPGAQHLHPLSRRGTGAAHLPRACAPARLREGRHDVQRVLRDRGRGGRRPALARAARRRARACCLRRAARAARPVRRAGTALSRTARGVLSRAVARRREACGQGAPVRGDGRRLPRAQGGALGRLAGLRPLVRARREQCATRVGGHVRGAGAGLPRAARSGRRRHGAVLRRGEGSSRSSIKVRATRRSPRWRTTRPCRHRSSTPAGRCDRAPATLRRANRAAAATSAPGARRRAAAGARRARRPATRRLPAARPCSPPARSGRPRPDRRAAPRRCPIGTRTKR